MTEPVPPTIVIDPRVHLALRLRATRTDCSPDELVDALLRKALAAELEEVAGVPPLAAVIQNHHDRQQGGARPPTQRAT